MKEKSSTKNEAKKKSFFAKAIERLDKRMQERAKSTSCCCGPSDKESGSCCS